MVLQIFDNWLGKSKNDEEPIGIIIMNRTVFEVPNYIMLFRCTKRRYAEAFLKGEIRLSTPRSWISFDDPGNKGVGDGLEGIFLSHYQSKEYEGIVVPDNIDIVKKENLIFYRRKEVLDFKCICAYGLDSQKFKKSIDENGRAHYCFSVPNSYFNGFSNGRTQDSYSNIDLSEQPVVILINNPYEFFQRIISSLVSMGVEQNDIIISPVTYIDKSKPMVVPQSTPIELLVKDNAYADQSEIRIIIKSKNKKFLDYLENHNNIITIGDISDISSISDYYFNDMKLERFGNRRLMISLPNPRTYNIKDLNYFELEDLVTNIINGFVKIENYPENAKTWQEKLKPIIDVFENKYGVHVFIEGNTISYYNLSNDLLIASNKKHEVDHQRRSLQQKLEQLLENNKIDEALKLCDRYYSENNYSGIAYYYAGKAFINKQQYEEAIEAFNTSFTNDYKRIESLDGIANAFYKKGEYKNAIGIYKIIQDVKGYDCYIWGNMAVCYCAVGEYENALTVLNRAIGKDPELAWCYSNKAFVCQKLGLYEEGIKSIKEAIRLEPDNSLNQMRLEELNKEYMK